VQLKARRRGRKLLACFNETNRVVIHDLDTGHHKVINVKRPWKSSASQHVIAVTTYQDGLHLFAIDGVLIHNIPDSTDARSVAFHPHNSNILAIGFKDGSLRMWNVSTQVYVSLFEDHTSSISNIRFAPDGRLFLTSWDKTASIVTLDEQFEIASSIKLKGHTDFVSDILPFPSSNQCVTCSVDRSIKVWDCATGTCIRTLTEHTSFVTSLAMHTNGQYFVSGSRDQSAIIWSCETFEVLRRLAFPPCVQSLAFAKNDTLFVGVYRHGVMSCNALTGEIGPVIFPGTGTGTASCLSLGKVD
jgi:WD40 repeat protein